MTIAGLLRLPQIVEHLREHCAKGRTGTLFLVSEDNRMALMRLEAGEIIAVTHRNRRGLEALAAVCEIKAAKVRFDETSTGPVDRHDLATRDILDHLDRVAREMPVSAVVSDAPDAPAFGPEVRAAVQKIMVKYIGPMAEIVCDDHFATATDARSLSRALAREISNPDQAARFLAEVGVVLA